MSLDQQPPQTFIGRECHFIGKLNSKGQVRIVGRFDGSVTAQGQVHIDTEARCRADIHAPWIIIDGVVDGNLIATKSIKVTAQGKVTGSITSPTLCFDERARMTGPCRVGRSVDVNVKAPSKLKKKVNGKQVKRDAQNGKRPSNVKKPRPRTMERRLHINDILSPVPTSGYLDH